jgi:hypothetical protein
MNVRRRSHRVAALLLLAVSAPGGQAGELRLVPTEDGVGRITVPADGAECFLAFGENSYAPDGFVGGDGEDLSRDRSRGVTPFPSPSSRT